MSMQIFEYEKFKITFENKDGNLMVNATEMAKPFGKLTKDFLVNNGTSKYIDAVSVERGIPLTELVIVIQGGNIQGTWMQEDIAIEFARWLSPKFAIWCNDRIKEVLKYGFTATDSKLEELISNPDLVISLATQLKSERAAKLLAQSQVKELKPKAEIADMINSAQNNLTMNEASKILGVSRNNLMKTLRECKILMSNNTPYQQYLNSGYFTVKVTPIKRGGYEFNTPQTYVTAKGLTWLAEKMK